MTLDVPNTVRVLRNRVQSDNGLTNVDLEYVNDIDECLTLYVNPDTLSTGLISGVAYDASTPPKCIAGSIFMDTNQTAVDPIFYSLIVLRSELHILDRKIEGEVPLAIQANTPAGKVQMQDLPKLHDELRRQKVLAAYGEMVEIYKYGVQTGRGFSPDMRDIIRYRRIPMDNFTIY